MKRWVIDRHGHDSLRIDDAPIGRNTRQGFGVSAQYPRLMILDDTMGLRLTFPFVPGSNMGGVVEAVGAGVTRFASGARNLKLRASV